MALHSQSGYGSGELIFVSGYDRLGIMNTIIIPKKMASRDDLVIIPRKKYKEFLRLLKKPKGKSYTRLDVDLDEAIAEYKAGKSYGPFDNARDLIKSLKTKR